LAGFSEDDPVCLIVPGLAGAPRQRCDGCSHERSCSVTIRTDFVSEQAAPIAIVTAAGGSTRCPTRRARPESGEQWKTPGKMEENVKRTLRAT
jgi:hypothetical protein